MTRNNWGLIVQQISLPLCSVETFLQNGSVAGMWLARGGKPWTGLGLRARSCLVDWWGIHVAPTATKKCMPS